MMAKKNLAMNRVILGILCGIAFGLLDAAMVVFGKHRSRLDSFDGALLCSRNRLSGLYGYPDASLIAYYAEAATSSGRSALPSRRRHSRLTIARFRTAVSGLRSYST